MLPALRRSVLPATSQLLQRLPIVQRVANLENRNIPGIKKLFSGEAKIPALATPRFVPIRERPLASHLGSAFWGPVARDSAAMSWRGIPMQKDPMFIATMQKLLTDELRPGTIIEFGSFRGGSALWLADIQQASGKKPNVISVDIDFSHLHPTAKADPRIMFLQGDSNQVEKIFPPERFSNLPHPIIVFEDAHINLRGILEHFHQFFIKPGDYLVVEDTNTLYNDECYKEWLKHFDKDFCNRKLANLNDKIRVLVKWLEDKEHLYAVDTHYVDPYGILNGTKNWNSVIKRIS